MPSLDSFAAFVDAFPRTAKGRALEQPVMPLAQEMYAVASQDPSGDGLCTSLAVPGQLTKNLVQAKT